MVFLKCKTERCVGTEYAYTVSSYVIINRNIKFRTEKYVGTISEAVKYNT
jgi:hypothetical protein